MTDEYILKQDVKDALQEKVFHNLTDEFYGAMQVLDELEPADVISKADMITLLEETEREVSKGINRYSTPWIMINSIFKIIKCMVNMFGGKSNG